jgi:stress-induced morphogen
VSSYSVLLKKNKMLKISTPNIFISFLCVGLTSESDMHAEYSCTLCESTFSLHSAVKRHMETAHGEPNVDDTEADSATSYTVECKACGGRFKNKHKLRVHRSVNGSCRAKLASRMSLKDVQCKDCGIICVNKYQLRVHRSKDGACRAERVTAVRKPVSVAPTDGGGTCSVCERTFSRKLSLIKHLREHRLQDAAMSATVAWIRQDARAAEEIEETETFQCTECESSFGSIDAVCWHLRIHSDRSHWQASKILALQSGDFKCTVCDRQFQTEADFVIHCAENEDAHECLECGRRIGSALLLRIHRLVHRQQDKPSRKNIKQGDPSRRKSPKKVVLHPCPICSRVFKHAIHLDIHMTMHTGVKNFVCHICAKQFATKGQLKRHIMIHEGKPSFDCAHCHKRFLLRDTLQRHVRAVHDKERRHLCSLCGWPFAEKHQLRKHMKVHTRNPEMVQFIVVNE